ncbi:MAG TPA: glycine--tRNA ligase subunit beta [Thermoanaerobaculia bacterium]|nr:glycine--tRNA ligase subunit beta [Thermoanaerobaculia bacterium]
MPDYFFELLTEEIPAWMHDAAAASLKERVLKSDLGATEDDVIIASTSRRIVIQCKNLSAGEQDRVQEVKGPPKKSAYDADGKPTPALLGFLKKQNAALEDVKDSGDEYVRVSRTIRGRATSDLLRERIPEIVEGLRWPKMMRWGNGEHAYIRPIHSCVSLYDGAHLPITIFGVASGTTTVGHRTLAPKAFDVTSYNDYVTKLELARVVIDPMRRREVMVHRARALANEVNGSPSVDASIWSQWQYLTEYPGLVRAQFRDEYLALPEEVLVTVMRVHQKQLPIRDANDKLTSSFLAVLDNEGDPDGNAAYGNSFVTNARFADAQFFYETDRRRPLEERLESLAHLQFQEKLGNYLDKTKRIEKIAAGICKAARIDGEAAAEAARLCKTDLVTEMVKEFTDLQGRVGGIYAREEGKSEAVWQAIYDHYQPVSVDDALPRNIAGCVVSLADRMDTLAGFFGIGAKPTGSKDPFGLRRAAQGVVQILLNRDKREVRITVQELIELAFDAYSFEGAEGARSDLGAFFFERIGTILQASAWQFAYDEIRAVMEARWWDLLLTDVVDRISALKAIRNEPNFLSVLDSAKRIENITAGHDVSGRVDAAHLEHPTEVRLNELADVVSGQIAELIAERRYPLAFESFAALAPELENFFKDVMVMVDDTRVRANRMSLLRKVGSAVRQIADVTKIVVDRRDYTRDSKA